MAPKKLQMKKAQGKEGWTMLGGVTDGSLEQDFSMAHICWHFHSRTLSPPGENWSPFFSHSQNWHPSVCQNKGRCLAWSQCARSLGAVVCYSLVMVGSTRRTRTLLLITKWLLELQLSSSSWITHLGGLMGVLSPQSHQPPNLLPTSDPVTESPVLATPTTSRLKVNL
jgi:hypothetical protein